jgi:hypothetical protein
MKDIDPTKAIEAALRIGFAEGQDQAKEEIEKLRAALREIEFSHIPDQPAAFDCTDLDWARRHVGKLRLIARAALGEKE